MEFADSVVNLSSETYVAARFTSSDRFIVSTGSRTSDYRCLKSADATGLVRAHVIEKRSRISLASAKLPLHPSTENSEEVFFLLINWWNCEDCRFEVVKPIKIAICRTSLSVTRNNFWLYRKLYKLCYYFSFKFLHPKRNKIK